MGYSYIIQCTEAYHIDPNRGRYKGPRKTRRGWQVIKTHKGVRYARCFERGDVSPEANFAEAVKWQNELFQRLELPVPINNS